MKKYIVNFVIVLIAAVSCEQLPDVVNIYGIGCKEKEAVVSSNPGEYSLNIYADGDFEAILDEHDTWLRFSSAKDSRIFRGSGDMSLSLQYDINRSIPRTATIVLKRGTNVFKFALTQEGILEGGLTIEQKNVLVASDGGNIGAKVITKMKPEEFTFSVNYKEENQVGWISEVSLKNNFICFNITANLSEEIRHAVIVAEYEGGKGYVQVAQFYDGCQTEALTIPQLKALLTEEGEYLIESHLVVEGLVINDNQENNGAENRMVSLDAQDLTQADKTLYIQNEDASEGMKLIFLESCAELVSRFDKINVDMYGLTLKREDNPVRYSISKVPLTSLIATMASDQPVMKERTLGQLTDSDLYTLVTIPDVEIPVRKGSYAPLDIRYMGAMVSYPMVIRDKEGTTSHMMVNLNCPWSRNGEELPEGSGPLTGIVVHEVADCFEWDSAREKEMIESEEVLLDYITGLGAPGKYQIRPLRKTDVGIADEASSAFSTLMYEWAYCDTLGVKLINNYSEQTLYPTYSSELQTASTLEDLKSTGAKFYCMGADGNEQPFRLCNDFTHLGPYTFGGRIERPSNGNGIYDYQGRTAHWAPYSSTETIGVLYSYYSSTGENRWAAEDNNGSGSNGAAWCVTGWSMEQYWCAEFPTSGLTAANSPLNLTFGTMNHINSYGAPRYWNVECSTDGQLWTKVHEYTVPDFAGSANKKIYKLPGTKFITVNLPDSMLGQDKVYVRLVPSSLKVGTASSYDGGSKITDSRYNAINYFAIRYNK